MSKFILSCFADEIDPSPRIQMDEMEKHGISYMEVRGINGKNISLYTPEDVRSIKEDFWKRGFRVSSLGSPIGKIKLTDDFEDQLNLFRRMLEIAKIFETDYIRMFSFFIPEEECDKSRDEVLRRWERYIEVARGSGITLLHENEKDIWGEKAARCLDLVESLGSDKLKLVFDPANFIQAQEETWPYAWNMLKPYVTYMHIKDAVMADGHVVPAGYGDGHLREILTDLWNSGYEGFLSLEPHLRNFQGFKDLEPNSPINLMEDSCPKWFTMAADSLKNLIADITR
ncbi:MAG: sugar phosphate isomerase/epimerase [Clostridia bacterium]|nr:sugar phosphate isomerase/epimerase [Clostridia bacterium]